MLKIFFWLPVATLNYDKKNIFNFEFSSRTLLVGQKGYKVL